MRSFLASSAQLNVNRQQSGRHRSYVKHHASSRKRSGMNFVNDSSGGGSQRGSVASQRKSAYNWDRMSMRSSVSGVRRESSAPFVNLDEGVVAELELLRSTGENDIDNPRSKVSPNTRCSNGLYQRLDRNPFTKRRKNERQRKASVKRRKETIRDLTKSTKVFPEEEDEEKKKKKKKKKGSYDKNDTSSPVRVLYGMFKQNEKGEVNMGDMLEFLELHEVLIPSDLRVIATLSKNLRKKKNKQGPGSVSSISSSMGSEEKLAKAKRDAEIVTITFEEFKTLAEQLELFSQNDVEKESKDNDLKYLTAGIGDGKFTDEIDFDVRKSPSMVAREMHLRGEIAPWYVILLGVRSHFSLCVCVCVCVSVSLSVKSIKNDT